jgi:hypothetical protein
MSTPNSFGARSPSWNTMTVPDGKTGYMELLFPWQAPGGGLFRVDENGNITGKTVEVPGVFNVMAYGAAGDGVTNDRAAIQAADAAAAAIDGGVVFFPPGTYYISFALQPAREPSGSITQPWRRRWTGNGAILTGSEGIFNFSGPTVASSIEIDHLTLVSNGGDIFDHINIFQWSFHDLNIIQNDPTACILNGAANFTNLQYTVFRDITASAVGNGRTVPVNNIVAASNDVFSSVVFDNVHLSYSDGTTYQAGYPFFHLETTSGIHQNIVFRNCQWGSPNSGVIKSLSGENVVIDACQIWDIDEVGANASMYYAGVSGSNTRVSKNFVVRDCQRSLGGVGGSVAWDVAVESTTLGVTIQNYSAASDITYVNLNNALNVVLINNQNNLAITNPGIDTILVGNGQLKSDGRSMIPTPWTALDLGYVAEAYDTAPVGPTARTAALGVLTLIGMWVTTAITVSTVAMYLSTNGNILASTENLVGLYNSAGQLLGYSTDQTTAWGSGAPKDLTMTLTAQAMGSLTIGPGLYWVGVLTNGTTAPQFGGASNQSNRWANGQLGVAGARFATNGSGLTALPASITPASNVLSQTAIWAAIY